MGKNERKFSKKRKDSKKKHIDFDKFSLKKIKFKKGNDYVEFDKEVES